MNDEHENKAPELESIVPLTELNTEGPEVGSNEHATTETPSKWPLLILVLLTIALLSASYYLWSQQQILVKQISGNGVGQLKKDIVGLSDRSREMSDMIAEQASQIAQQQKIINLIQKNKHDQQALAGADANLLEVESLLRLAKNRYELTRDIETSLLAMQLAARYLEFYQAGPLQEINLLVKKEISALKGLQVVDVATFLQQVESMIMTVDSLTLSSASTESIAVQSPVNEPEQLSGEWDAKWKEFLKQVKPMLTIRRNVTAIPTLLSLEEVSLVRSILKSRYENLRLAIILHDENLMQQASDSIRQWLGRYFKVDQHDVIKHFQILDSLQAILENMQYPPIGEALLRLIEVRSGTENGGEKPSASQTNISAADSLEANRVQNP